MVKMSDDEFNDIFHEVDYYDIESIVKFFWICSIEGKMDEFAQRHSTGYIAFSGEELSEALFGYMCERFKETFEEYDTFTTLNKLYNKLLKSSGLSERDKVLLFDECIHAQHETGAIFDIDMDDLHAEVDALYN